MGLPFQCGRLGKKGLKATTNLSDSDDTCHKNESGGPLVSSLAHKELESQCSILTSKDLNKL